MAMNIQTNLKEHSLPNGLPPQFNKPNMMATPMQFNGTSSSHSSRTASPANRLTHIPTSQLPPVRSVIPASQLPPSTNVNQLAQSYSHLSVTPTSSPSKQNFNASTPVLNYVQDCSEQNIQPNISPIVSSTNFTHSTQSYFTSVAPSTNQTRVVPPTITNVPSGPERQIFSSQNKLPPPNSNVLPAKQIVDTDVKQNRDEFKQEHNDKHLIGTFPQKPQLLNNVGTVTHNQQAYFANKTLPQNQDTSKFAPSQQDTFKFIPNINQNQAHMPPNIPSISLGNANVTQAQHIQPTLAHSVPQARQNIPHSGFYEQKQLPPQLSSNLAPPPPSSLVVQEQRIQQPNMQVPSYTNTPSIMSNVQLAKTNVHSNRYPAASHSNVPNIPHQGISVPQPQVQPNIYQNQPGISNNHYQNYNTSNIVNSGFDRAWGHESCDLLQCTNVLPYGKLEPPKISLGQTLLDASNCSPDIFRCTMTKIPDTNSLLQKSRLPLGVLIHPFKDLDHLPVIQCSTIVRCRACRTYINPFVYFVDTKRWKCNLCYRVNELPEEFQFDPVSKTYGDPSRRPEIKSSTIEYIAPSEYMLRPPQPAVYLFLLDVSHAAVESGYLHVFCDVLAASLTSLPGDARTQVGFIAYNSALHFYSLAEGLTQPHEMTILEIEDIFLPCPDNLIVNLNERKELITDLLAHLPTRFNSSFDTGSALGAALQAAHKMISSTGGRVTIFQAALPTVGPGALLPREDPSQRAGVEVHHLNPANDFYKRLALDCSGQQIAVDLFVVNSQYVDLATISGISRFSGGCIHHFPLFKGSRTLHAEKLERCFKRYLTRKIGFEAVMRIRCTRGLSIHTFHGNFFVRSTDLLSLPNINPETGFGMQVAIEESLSDINSVCFQAALLYTSSKGERRIRVHTLCVPIASTLSDIIHSADQQCIIGLLSKMAVDRSMLSSLADAREAFINVAIDILSSYKLSLNLGSPPSGLLAPGCLKLLPIYISALLKYVAFRTGTSTRLDDRIKAMCDMKTLPLCMLIQQIYPDLYPVHNLEDQHTAFRDGEPVPQPPHLQLTARCLDSKGAFLMDMGEQMVLIVGPSVSQTFLQEILGVPDYNSISEEIYELPVLNNPHNQRLHSFINSLNDEKPYVASLHIIRDNSPSRHIFIERLIEDRVENALSYHEFLQHLKTQVK